MSIMFCKSKTTDDDDDDLEYRHRIQKGDHLFRWTNVFLVPVQKHAICMAASEDSITIVDFGLTERRDFTEEDVQGELVIDEGDRALRESINEIVSPQRISIETLTEKKEISQWKKVEYDKVDKKRWFWNRNKDENENEEASSPPNILEEQLVDISERSETIEDRSDRGETGADQEEEEEAVKKWWFWKKNNDTKLTEESPSSTDILETQAVDVGEGSGLGSDPEEVVTKKGWGFWNRKKPQAELDTETDQEETSFNEPSLHRPRTTKPVVREKPKLPKSDPTNIVLARLRYLLTNPDVLPQHHILFSNSECVAVWVKTGRWSTIQASVFLQSTMAGNIKSTVTIAATLAGTSVTVPAAGAWGWLGFTTEVSLLAAQPWLIPLVAGFGIAAVGTPIIVLRNARKQWDKVTQKLTGGFWDWAPPDVYIEAIKSWSVLE